MALVLTTWAAASATPALALAPEHEVRRLMLATESAVEAENWAEAGEYLNRLQGMEAEKPPEYFFYRGQAMLQAKRLNEARAAFEQYVSLAGAEGEHYQRTLTLITDIERTNRANVAQLAENAGQVEKPVAVIEPAGDQDLSTLRRLYLADTDREALTIHLNALLDAAGWREDKTVVRLDRPADIEYQVTVDGASLNVQETRRSGGQATVRQTSTFNVFGINPQPEWDCEPVVGACWVFDPRDGSRLLQLNQNADATREIARTLGRLIRNLQQGSSGS
ncbi:MAG: hypothetical protein B7X58_06770 [Marinobacter sp. 34-60-7]|nr:MAG: hypothetical protein B7X58_06770 [Marinobacter sp. 34-60-7]